MKMEKSVKMTLIISISIVFIALVGFYTLSTLMPSNTNNINVNGVSNLKVIPDITSIYFSAESEGETAVEARDGNKKIVDALTMS